MSSASSSSRPLAVTESHGLGPSSEDSATSFCQNIGLMRLRRTDSPSNHLFLSDGADLSSQFLFYSMTWANWVFLRVFSYSSISFCFLITIRNIGIRNIHILFHRYPFLIYLAMISEPHSYYIIFFLTQALYLYLLNPYYRLNLILNCIQVY